MNSSLDPVITAPTDLADRELDALIATVDDCPKFAPLRHQILVIANGSPLSRDSASVAFLPHPRTVCFAECHRVSVLGTDLLIRESP